VIIGDMTDVVGFSERAVDFYSRLAADNTKDFWVANKSTYDAEVRDPMRALISSLESEFGPGKLFRPNRDTRFRQDKSPYKTSQAAIVGHRPGLGYYVQLDAAGLAAGGGFRSHDPSEVGRYRAAVDDPASGAALDGIVAALGEAGFAIEGERLKTVPRGYDRDHPRIELLRGRSLMVVRAFGAPDWLASPRVVEEVTAVWREVRPLVHWASAHVDAH
jgi:uncharacterized protein (TIGR02453 family)